MNFGNPVADPQIQSHAEYLAGQWDRSGFIVTAPFASVDASHPTPHTGIDMGQGRAGGDVLATADGAVSLLRAIDGVVIVNHAGGWQTVYAHLQQPVDVLTGSPVKRGQVIGHVGATGTLLAHLHYEIKLNGAHQDPWPYLNAPASGGDVNLKGTLVRWVQNRTLNLTQGAPLVEDPTAMPYSNLAAFPVNQAFTPSVEVTGNSLLGSDHWYGGWISGSPPKFGYCPAAACGPLRPIEAGQDCSELQGKIAAAKAALA